MPVIHDSNALIPAPFLAIREEPVTDESGKRIGQTFLLTVRGKLTAEKGSPRADGSFWTASGYPPDQTVAADSRLTVILKKQAALRDLFKTDGKTFEVQGYDGMQPFKCNPRIKSVEFPDGEGKGANWTEYCEYVITMEADCVTGLSGDDCFDGAKVSRTQNEWNIEVLDEDKGTYRLTHAASATGRRHYLEDGTLEKEAWEQARDWVLNVTGDGPGLGLVPDRMTAPGVLDADDLQAFNYIRSQAVNESAGTFAVTESWVCYDPQGEAPAVNEYTVNLRYSAQENRTTASVDGTVTGLAVRDNSTRELVSTKWENAVAKFDTNILPFMFSTAQNMVGAENPLNPVAVSQAVGKNPVSGTITYHYEYDNRPTPVTPGALAEIVTLTNDNAADAFAQVPVLGRPFGPVLQSLGSVTAKRRSVSIEIQMPPSAQGYASIAPDTAAIVLSLFPFAGFAVFLEQDQESFTPATGRYTRQSTFVWE
jgi:hypothetical protein